MLIEIEGYRNIEKMKYEIDDKKLNLLFGVSGSGKSSVAMALCADDLNYNKKADFSGEVKVLVDGLDANRNNITVFSSETVNSYISNGDEGTVFNIIIDDESELNKEQDKFDKYMVRFRNTIESYEELYNNLKELTSSLVGSLTSKNQFRPSSKIKQLENNFTGKTNTRVVREMNNIEPRKLEWIIQGTALIEDDCSCPFCFKKMNQKRISKIKKYSDFDIKNLKLVRDKTEKIITVGINKPTYTSLGVTRLSEEMKKAAIAVKEFEKLKEIVNNIDSDNILKDITEIEINENVYYFFPNLQRIVNGLNINISNIKSKTELLNEKTKGVLVRKVKNLNERIRMLGVPYEIEPQYKKNKIKSYKLKLISDASEIDRRRSLSNGEMNLIALLIFILDVSRNGTNKLCIIDDPVSSYDEHRRKIIYEFIKEILKNVTVLVLSHDSVFARIASNEPIENTVGSIAYFENDCGEVKLKTITSEDFDKFDDFLINRINESNDYYQKIINLRMLYEGKKTQVYSYLSKILHFENKEKIDLWLESKAKSEDDILMRILNEKSITLPKFEDEFMNSIDSSEYSLIEKAALVRENIPTTPTHFRNELNHIMHVNDRHVICLNPHKYSFCSGSTMSGIIREFTTLIS